MIKLFLYKIWRRDFISVTFQYATWGSSNITVICNDGRACFLVGIVCNYMKFYTYDGYMSNLVLQIPDLNMGMA